MYPEMELLFPHRCIASLENARDELWAAWIRRLAVLPETNLDSLAFILMIVRLCECVKCNPGSYKASLGCTVCAQRATGGNEEPHSLWLARFERARDDLAAFLASQEEG